MPSVEVVGVHEVGADKPCALVELIVRDSGGPIDLGEITQEDPALPRAEWQVPYAEKLLDEEGRAVAQDLWQGPGSPEAWLGDVRLVFFFHYLDLARPLRTPFGEVTVPAATPRPSRLDFLTYDTP